MYMYYISDPLSWGLYILHARWFKVCVGGEGGDTE